MRDARHKVKNNMASAMQGDYILPPLSPEDEGKLWSPSNIMLFS